MTPETLAPDPSTAPLQAPLSAAESRPAGPLLSISLPLLRVGIVLPTSSQVCPFCSPYKTILYTMVFLHTFLALQERSCRLAHFMASPCPCADSFQEHVPRLARENCQQRLPYHLTHARLALAFMMVSLDLRPLTVQPPLSGYKSMPLVPTCPSATSQRPTLHLSDPSLDDSVSDNIEACAPGAQHAIMKPRIPPQSLMYFSILLLTAPSPIKSWGSGSRFCS